MGVWRSENVVLTQEGQRLLNQVILGGDTLEITKVLLGAGRVPAADLFYATSVSTVKQAATIVGVVVKDNSSVLEIQASNQGISDWYFLQQIGVFATNGSGSEILYAIAQCEEGLGDVMPSYVNSEVIVSYALIVQHNNLPGAQINITIDQNAFVTNDRFLTLINDLQNNTAGISQHINDMNAHQPLIHQWKKAEAVTVGTIRKPYNDVEGRRILVCKQAGTTGTTQPDFLSASYTSTVVDGSASWVVYDWNNLGAMVSNIQGKTLDTAGGIATLDAEKKIKNTYLENYWKPNEEVAAGVVRYFTSKDNSAWYLKCVIGGRTAASATDEPAPNPSNIANIVDGGVTWNCYAVGSGDGSGGGGGTGTGGGGGTELFYDVYVSEAKEIPTNGGVISEQIPTALEGISVEKMVGHVFLQCVEDDGEYTVGNKIEQVCQYQITGGRFPLTPVISDTEFYVVIANNQPNLVGLTCNTGMEFNLTNSKWRLYFSILYPSAKIVNTVSQAEYVPLGTFAQALGDTLAGYDEAAGQTRQIAQYEDFYYSYLTNPFNAANIKTEEQWQSYSQTHANVPYFSFGDSDLSVTPPVMGTYFRMPKMAGTLSLSGTGGAQEIMSSKIFVKTFMGYKFPAEKNIEDVIKTVEEDFAWQVPQALGNFGVQKSEFYIDDSYDDFYKIVVPAGTNIVGTLPSSITLPFWFELLRGDVGDQILSTQIVWDSSGTRYTRVGLTDYDNTPFTTWGAWVSGGSGSGGGGGAIDDSNYMKLLSTVTQILQSNVAMQKGKKILAVKANNQQVPLAFIGDYDDGAGGTYEQIGLGAESEPLCLNHSAKSADGKVVGKNILVNYTDESGAAKVDTVAYTSDLVGIGGQARPWLTKILPDTTLPNTNTTTNRAIVLTHNISNIDLTTAFTRTLLVCKVANSGWAVGEATDLITMDTNDYATPPPLGVLTAGSVIIPRGSSNSGILVFNKTTYAAVPITAANLAANWYLRVIIYYQEVVTP